MPTALDEQTPTSAEAAEIRKQLELLVSSEVFRSSRRSVAFLRYIVEETLHGNAEELKERTIGVGVFGKALTYDTNLDHAVRTAASELRKRLAIYYGQEEHRDEARIQLLPGSYVPQFRPALPKPFGVTAAPAEPSELPFPASDLATSAPAPVHPLEPVGHRRRWWPWAAASTSALLLLTFTALAWMKPKLTPQQAFWKPLLQTPGPVLIAVGDVPNGPPVTVANAANDTQAELTPAAPGPPRVPYADAVTIARVAGLLSSMGKDFLVRRESTSSFSELRERPLVLVGAFNNEWSLRFARDLRFSLALDSERRAIYIRDRQHPESREWQWGIDKHPAEKDRNSSTVLHDYALISRVLDSETGHEVVIIGGLYTYGTQAAGEFLTGDGMAELARRVPLDARSKRLQIVLETQVTDGAAGPPRIVAVHAE